MRVRFLNRSALLAASVLLCVACGGDGATAPTPTSPVTADATTSNPATTNPASTDPATTNPATNAPGTPAATPALGDPLVTLDEPVDLAWRPGDDTLYLVERPGRVRAVREGTLDPTPVLDVSDLTQSEGERGLLGLAFSTDGRFGYVNYTDLDGNTVIAGYPVGDDGRFDEGGRFVVYEITQPFPNHNGGAVLVGPDGLLYVPTGDGGSAGDPLRAALDLSSPLGKILRIKPEPAGGYTVPDDNPYVGVEGALPEIWSTGLRNPWRVSFDRTTGDLWVADVGQDAWEEISVAWADEGAGRGASFGWSAYEGTHRYHDDQPADGHLAPVFEYPQGDLGCSVSGGVRYRGAAVAGLQGHYVFGDFCSGRVWALPVAPDRTVGEPVEIGRVSNVVAVAEGPDKELWVLSLVGEVFPIVSAAR